MEYFKGTLENSTSAIIDFNRVHSREKPTLNGACPAF